MAYSSENEYDEATVVKGGEITEAGKRDLEA